MGTIIGASDVDDEDIMRMCIDLTEQASKRKFDQEGSLSGETSVRKKIPRRKSPVRMLLLLVGGEVLLLLRQQ